MNEVARRNFQALSLQGTNNDSGRQGPSAGTTMENEMGFAPAKKETTESVEKNTSSFVQDIHDPNHFYSSPKRGLMSASTSAFTKPRADTTGNEASHTANGYIGGEQAHQQYNMPPIHPKAADAMAHHVVTKLQKEAAAMIAAGRSPTGNTPYHRRASPIARMRDNNIQNETMATDADRPPKKDPKSDREVKEEKQRQWKKKAKIAKEKQRRKRQAQRDESTYGSTSAGHFNAKSAIIGCVLDNVENTDLFKRITACSGGAYSRNSCIPSECEYDEYGSASSTGSYSENTEEDEDVQGDGRKQLGRQRKKKWEISSRDSSIDHSSGPSVDTTVPEEMNASFLSDDGMDHNDEGPFNRSKAELNQSMETARSVGATIAGRSNATDYAFVGFSSLDRSVNNTVRSGNNWAPVPTMGIRHQPAANAFTETGDVPGYVKAFLQDIQTRGESMLWHQETSAIDPTTIILRLKRGYRLPSGTFCAPRLIWTDPRINQNYGFDVFEIRSLNHANMLHLKDFPYAIPGRSVMVHLKNNTSFIFEAGTEEDVMRFVRGIKWAIARLAYNLVTGNLDGSCELLDLGLVEAIGSNSQLDWSRAMDDVTEIMISKAWASFEV